MTDLKSFHFYLENQTYFIRGEWFTPEFTREKIVTCYATGSVDGWIIAKSQSAAKDKLDILIFEEVNLEKNLRRKLMEDEHLQVLGIILPYIDLIPLNSDDYEIKLLPCRAFGQQMSSLAYLSQPRTSMRDIDRKIPVNVLKKLDLEYQRLAYRF